MSVWDRPPDFTSQVVHLHRLMNSKNGNPRWRVTFANGRVAQTIHDADVNYGIGNPELQSDVDVWLSAGRIGRMEPASS